MALEDVPTVVDLIRAKVIIAGLCLKNVEQIVGETYARARFVQRRNVPSIGQNDALPHDNQIQTLIYSMFTTHTIAENEYEEKKTKINCKNIWLIAHFLHSYC